VQILITADDPPGVRATITELINAGFGHIAVGVRPPAPANVARWLVDEIIGPVRDALEA
jgi:hypothetical protein